MAGKPVKKNPKTRSSVDDVGVLKKEYLELLNGNGLMGYCAEKVGRTLTTITRWREADPDFDQGVMDAYERATQRLRENIYLRAQDPRDRMSAVLAMFELKRRDPAYRDHLNLNAKHLVAGTIATPSKTDKEPRDILKTLTKELLKELAQKPNDL